MLASAVGGLLTRTLVRSQVECVTENASVYSFHMLMWLLCDFNAAKLFLRVNILVVAIPALVSQQWADSKAPRSFIWVWVGARDGDILAILYVKEDFYKGGIFSLRTGTHLAFVIMSETLSVYVLKL